jgi:hypothetical protein
VAALFVIVTRFLSSKTAAASSKKAAGKCSNKFLVV